MQFLFKLWILFLFPLAAPAQENTAIKDLLKEAKAKRYYQPTQSGKIAEYILNQNGSKAINVEAQLLLAQSFYVRGNYNEASKNALEAKRLADKATDIHLKVKSDIFAIFMMRKLGLETVALNYSEELRTLENKIQDKRIISRILGKMKQDSALVNFQEGNFLEAKKLLQEAKTFFLKIEDTLANQEIDIASAEIYLKTNQLDSIKISLAKILENKEEESFQNLQALTVLGTLYFNKKNYIKSSEIFLKALAISLKLPNKQYENKCLQALTTNYLALEDTKRFYSYKQRANLSATEMEADKNLAINSVYNFINSSQKQFSKNRLHKGYLWIYISGGFFLILFITGIIVNYLYLSKTKEYHAIWKYVQPKEPIIASNLPRETLEKSSIVPEEIEAALLQKLKKFEAGKKFTNQDMSIALLASQFDTNTKYLSEVINRQKGKNFNSYINELRINYIIEKLKTYPIYFNYKVSYLAKECGFSSHSSFATVFKSVTGISPSKFMELLQQRQETA
ncbi:MAG: helix-turn-helix domain-containing protein [Aequorivita sp.]